MTDAAGRVVWREHRDQAGNEQRQLSVPTAQLAAAGLYFVQVRSGGTANVYRFSK